MSQLKNLIGLNPSSPELSQYLYSLAKHVSYPNAVVPEVKSYRDAVYLNYYSLGLSLLFTPQGDYKPKPGLKFSALDTEQLVLDSMDIYNIPNPVSRTQGTSTRIAELAFSSFPQFPLVFDVSGEIKDKDGKLMPRPAQLKAGEKTSGKEFVEHLGEPDRKGGGAGPSSGSIGIWCEWTKDGLMIEFGGDEAKGPQAWERGKDAVWKVITIFSSSGSC
ncbi:hypothetical protein H0H81_000959 [Sphagnurus paluster]|uniref:Uncharacterized protein n=1 Tax=Sphagnurus paluster TaxID=117069 RepID=A0A9P7GUT8_9AGAR|nr:hypothetical protein H0H81_000959 [Sphagnurus paluster]